MIQMTQLPNRASFSPTLFVGEKVPKADEGALPNIWLAPLDEALVRERPLMSIPDSGTSPLIRLRHLLPR